MPTISRYKNLHTVLHLPLNVEIVDCSVDVEPSFILKASDEYTSPILEETGDIEKADP